MEDTPAHSKRGPSGAHRWRRCPGSLAAEEQHPDSAGREAAEGTVFHEYAAMCLMTGLDPEHFPLGVWHEEEGFDIEYSAEMADHMREGLAWVRDQIEPGDILVVERRVDISPWTAGPDFGTCDCAIVKVRKRKIIVFDWKYGKGLAVSPIKNDQCYLYGLGVWNDIAQQYFRGIDPHDIEVLFRIEQPRHMMGGGEWETTVAEMLAEGETILEDAKATYEPDAPRIAGEKQCHFCRARVHCGTKQRWLLKSYGMKLEEVHDWIDNDLPPAFEDPEELDLEVRSYMLLHWKAFASYVKQVHKFAMQEIRAGKSVPLLKAIRGRGTRRVYVSTRLEETKKKIELAVGKDKAYVINPLSPAELEKLLGKKRFKTEFGDLVTQPEPKPILVSLNHPGEAVQSYGSMFTDDDVDIDADDNDEM